MCRERHSSPPDLGREIEAAGTESMKEGEPGLEPAAPRASLASWLGGEGRVPQSEGSHHLRAQHRTVLMGGYCPVTASPPLSCHTLVSGRA